MVHYGIFLRNCFIVFLVVILKVSNAQTVNHKKSDRPKLVIGIIIDQMRYDYLYRYSDKFGTDGFRRLLREGYLFRDAQYNYVPTYTGPGHATVYTGATPSYSGIIANDWYERSEKKSVYVTEDTSVRAVGGTGPNGQMSPHRMLVTTITDELRLATNKGSKVIGISLKDRGAILPAGHIPNAAYWYDNQTGNWITSSFYMNQLPQWVQTFNNQKMPDAYLSKSWETLYPLSSYTNGLVNGANYRNAYKGETNNKFPHDLSKLKALNGYELLRMSPYGNTITLEFSLKAIEEEKLGNGKSTDFLAISFSSTDYIGHQFGIESIEVQDAYARLDRDIAKLLKYIDTHFGKENVLVFLTADHGAAETPLYMQSLKIPAGVFNANTIKQSLNNLLSSTFGAGNWIYSYINGQVYLNHDLMLEKKINGRAMETRCVDYLKDLPGVYKVYTTNDLQGMNNDIHLQQISNGIMPSRSGDIIIQLLPGWFDADFAATGGTTHGSGYSYDTHVPVIWYGWKIKKGSSGKKIFITDIAPTLADLLHINTPNGTSGNVLSDDILTK